MSIFTLLWIWTCAWLTFAGWILSAFHELNARGYAVAIMVGLALALIWRKQTTGPLSHKICWSRLRRRFRRPFPLAFLVLAGLAFLGGVIYPPTNYDGLTYRLPRVLHWLAAGQWHWIHTIFPRVNTRACGIEWVSVPLIALTQTDRLLFLINTVSIVLLPGLVFSLLTRMGVRPRVAWHWMWLVPTGYCFLLQAGSIGNDLYGALFATAAVDGALRVRTSQSQRDLFASVLAAALLTGAKTSNQPLLLPWAVAILPAWRLWFRWPFRLTAVCLIAVSASFLPTALINQYYYHDWTGMKSEGIFVKSYPALRMVANGVLLTIQNLTPPVFPMAGNWNRAVPAAIPAGLSLRLHQTMAEPEASEFQLQQMQIEENAGLGLGVSLLLILSVLAGLRQRGADLLRWRPDSREAVWQAGLRLSPFISLLVFAILSSLGAIARITAPYYALMLPFFLCGSAQTGVIKRGWWRALAAVAFLMAGMLVIVSPERPLFPAVKIFADLQARHPNSVALERAAAVYGTYHDRHEAFAPVLAKLPPDVQVLGLFTYDDPETSLWQPFGSRRIEHICPEDTAKDMNQRGIHYVLIPAVRLKQYFHLSAEEWVHHLKATVIQKIPLELRVSEGPAEWWVVKLP